MRLGPLVAATALAALTAACSKPESAKTETQPTATEQAAPAPSSEEKLKLLAALPAPYNTADLAKGEAEFGLCRSCHTIAQGGANMTGPNLYGVFGRKAASVADYKYSDALKNAGFVWDASHLEQWLAQPQTFLPGTKMTFAGIKDQTDRDALIAYLMVETGHTPQ